MSEAELTNVKSIWSEDLHKVNTYTETLF